MLKSAYRILEKYALIIEYHEGLFTLEGIIEFRKKQALDKKFSSDYSILMDLNNVEIAGSTEEVKSYVKFYIDNKNIVGKRSMAVLTNTPNQVFYTTLFEQHNTRLPQKTKIFSTVGAALRWLNANIADSQVIDILEDLRKSVSVEQKS